MRERVGGGLSVTYGGANSVPGDGEAAAVPVSHTDVLLYVLVERAHRCCYLFLQSLQRLVVLSRVDLDCV